VADGEGVMGANGPTGNQLAHFFRDVLGATVATGLDSGLSTEMVLRDANGPRRINTLTGEDATIQVDPYSAALFESPPLSWGAVANYLLVSGVVRGTGPTNICGGHGVIVTRPGHNLGDPCTCSGPGQSRGTLACNRDKNRLVCCPCQSAPGCD
jgi:hypothetical protein